jgi:hypothetical protein
VLVGENAAQERRPRHRRATSCPAVRLGVGELLGEVSRLSVRGGEDVAAVEDLAGRKGRMELCP